MVIKLNENWHVDHPRSIDRFADLALHSMKENYKAKSIHPWSKAKQKETLKTDKPTSALEYLKNNFAGKEVQDTREKLKH